MCRSSSLLLLITVAVGHAGCASVPASRVQDDVSRRSGSAVAWPHTAAEEKQAGDKVGALLKGELAADTAAAIALLNNRRLRATFEEGDMEMPVPENSVPIIGGQGQYDYVTMGEMFTVLKVRQELPADGSDPGWFKSTPGTLSLPATDDELNREGVALAAKAAHLEVRGQKVELCGDGPSTAPITGSIIGRVRGASM